MKVRASSDNEYKLEYSIESQSKIVKITESIQNKGKNKIVEPN